MKRQTILHGSLSLLLIAAACRGQHADPEPPRPNIIQIMADDLGWGAAGYNGQEYVKTPNIDRLARGGLIFTRAYAAPVCSPTRASLQVGYHTGHTWTDRNIRWPKKGFRQGSVTIGEVLQRAGYVTGAFGKWGFGGSQGEGAILRSNPVIDNPVTLPTNQGYSEFYGCLDHVRAHTFFMDSLWESAEGAPHGLKLTPTGNTPEKPFTRFCDDLYAERAAAFLLKHARGSTPFYLQLHFQTPHAPLSQITELDGWFDDYADADTSHWSAPAKQYAAMVTRMDRSIGQLVALLRDPDQDGNTSDSVAGRTLVLFVSDNGGYRGPKFVERFQTNGPLRGGKGSLYEGGIRVPMFAYWPGTIEPGQTTDRPVDISDWLPTFAELAGTPATIAVDGVSFAPTLDGHGTQRERPCLAFEDHDDWAIIQGDYKLIRLNRNGGQYQLFHLNRDPGERENLLARDDDPERNRHLEIKSRLETLAAAEGVVHGSAIGKAKAREDGRDLGEPYFVTYHLWRGGDGDRLELAEHWSGNGTPADTWSAVLANNTATPCTAKVNGTVDFLGIEIRCEQAHQTVQIGQNGRLTGKNGVRLADGARLELIDGAVASSRWTEVMPESTLTGRGLVVGSLYNQGTVEVDGELRVQGDYHQLAGGTLRVRLRTQGAPQSRLFVGDTFHAAGRLEVAFAEDITPKAGTQIRIIRAHAIRGRFDHLDLPELGPGRHWDTGELHRTGLLRIE